MATEFERWLKTRPKVIQELGKKYPEGKYIIKDGAPYSISCAGTIVELVSYNGNGDVGVVVSAEHKKPEALNHEQRLGKKFGHSQEKMNEIKESNIKVQINPEWLEPIKQE